MKCNAPFQWVLFLYEVLTNLLTVMQGVRRTPDIKSAENFYEQKGVNEKKVESPPHQSITRSFHNLFYLISLTCFVFLLLALQMIELAQRIISK